VSLRGVPRPLCAVLRHKNSLGKAPKMSKYEPLKRFLEAIQPGIDEKSMSFSEMERILGYKLPRSAYEHRAWWSNPTSPGDHPYAQSWLEAGWKVDAVDQLDMRVHFRRTHSKVVEKKIPPVIAMQSTPIPQKGIGYTGGTTQSIDSKRFLLDLGFEGIGEWFLENGSLQFKLAKYGNELNILYAFIVQGDVKYIGKSNLTLYARMNGYKNPGPTQSTNIDKKARIVDSLRNGISVQILAFLQKERMFYRGAPINLAAGLEDGLLTRIRPPWNNRI
jgi:hypothetical protein